jgi:hypothetical protein
MVEFKDWPTDTKKHRLDALELVQGLMEVYTLKTIGATRAHCVMARFLDRLVKSRLNHWSEPVVGVSLVRHFAIDLSVEWETDYMVKVDSGIIEKIVWNCVEKTHQREVNAGSELSRWNPLNWWRILFPPL